MNRTKKSICKLLLTMIILSLILCMTAIPSSAANPNAENIICAYSDQSGKALGGSNGVPVFLGNGDFVIVTPSSLYRGDEYTYEAFYQGEFVEIEILTLEAIPGLASWSCDELQGSDVFTQASTYVGENAYLILLDEDLKSVKHECQISKCFKDGEYWNLDFTYKEDIPSTYKIKWPVPIVNEDNELIGLIFTNGDDDVVAYATLPPKTPSPPASEEEPTSNPEIVTEEPSRNNNDDDIKSGEDVDIVKKDETDEKSAVIITAVIIALVAAGITIVFLKKKKNKNTNATETPVPVIPDSNYSPTMPIPEDLEATNTPEVNNVSEVPDVPKIPDDANSIEADSTSMDTLPKEKGLQVYLVGVNGPFAGQEFLISDYEITIGRAKDVTIRFPEDADGVSRHHCKIMMFEGALSIVDLKSGFGTYLQDQGKLPFDTVFPLKVGDIITLGSNRYTFTIEIK